WTGLRDREPGGGKDQNPQQIPTLNSAGHGQGQRVERVDGEGIHVLALQGILRIRRHRDSPMQLREMASPSRYRRVHCFFKPYMTITPFSTTETTARDAADLGYQVILVDDACAAFSPEIHEATLLSFQGPFGRVR